MLSKTTTAKILTCIQNDIRVNGIKNYHLLLAVCSFINSVFCQCLYVEYWIFDMNFGMNSCNTEMGYELRNIDTIDKFVNFLFSKYDKDK
jgi:hypothetical protein